MAGTVLYAIDDLALQGTVFEEGVLVYVVLRRRARRAWAASSTGRRSSGASPRRPPRSVPLALLGVLAIVLASFPHYIAGFLDQPAGPVYDNDDLAIWNILVLVGHALMAPHGARLHRPARRSHRVRDVTSAIGDDPWDGQTLEWATTSPAPGDNFVDVPIVHSAEPMLDLKAPDDTAANSASPTGAAPDVRPTPRPDRRPRVARRSSARLRRRRR